MQVRPISMETSLLPMAHGSALFTRGETQALATATLGSKVFSTSLTCCLASFLLSLLSISLGV